MVTLGYIIWGLTLTGNAFLLLLLTWREWYVRYNWLSISVAASIVVDLLLMRAHVQSHPLYEPLRIFIFYGLFYILDAAVIWEAWRLKERRVQIPVEIYLGMQIFAMLLHRTDFIWSTYYLECFLRWFNLGMICWFICIFREDPRYNI